MQSQVQRMHQFGSALRADFNPNTSYLDLLVEFKPIDPKELVRDYFDLELQLMAITGKPVDLVMADAVRNPYCVLTSRQRIQIRPNLRSSEKIKGCRTNISASEYPSILSTKSLT
jgi:predicted nucleotidyltransferase